MAEVTLPGLTPDLSVAITDHPTRVGQRGLTTLSSGKAVALTKLIRPLLPEGVSQTPGFLAGYSFY
jgi:hypothetical protein